MPSITIQIAKLSVEKKKELIGKLTSAASEVTGIADEKFFVFVDEYDHDNIGVGGQSLADKMAGK